MDTVYSLEVWVPDGERWRWSVIGAYPTLDMAVAVGEGFLSVKPYRVRRVTDVGDGFCLVYLVGVLLLQILMAYQNGTHPE